METYWSLVHPEAGAFGASFPDVPGCVAAADTMERALDDAREALSAHLAWMRADGDAIPVGRPYAALTIDPDVAEAAVDATWHLVQPRIVQAPRLRINIMIDPGLLREADEEAAAAGMTRSGFIEAALRQVRGVDIVEAAAVPVTPDDRDAVNRIVEASVGGARAKVKPLARGIKARKVKVAGGAA